MKNREPKSGYVRCACCNLPIAITADDVGLSVTCPRTRRLIAVKEADLNGTPPPAAKPPAAAPQPPPSARETVADSRSAPRPVEPAPPRPTRRDEASDFAPPLPNRGGPSSVAVALIGVSVLLVIVALVGAIWKMSRIEPERETVEQPEERQAEPPLPAVAPPVAPPTPPAPKTTTPVGTVAPPIMPPVVPPVAPVEVRPPVVPAPPPRIPPVALPPPPKADPNVGVAAAAVASLSLLATVEAGLDGCVGACADPDAAVRRRAATALAAFLANPDEKVRRKAAAALAELGGDAEPALAALQDAVNDADAEVKKSAKAAVEKIDEAAAFAKADKTQKELLLLAKQLQAKEPAKRVKALEQIAPYGASANIVGEQLIAAMADPVPAVQIAATEALEKVNPKVQPHVFTLLYGMNKAGAVNELEKLGSDAAITVPMLLHFTGMTKQPASLGNLYATVVKIAPKDKRVVAFILTTVAEPIPASERTTFYPSRRLFDRAPRTPTERRYAAMQLLSGVEADAAIKVKSLTSALGDGHLTTYVIAALQGYGKDAEPALPLLKKLKFSKDDAVRKSANDAIEKIEAAVGGK